MPDVGVRRGMGEVQAPKPRHLRGSGPEACWSRTSTSIRALRQAARETRPTACFPRWRGSASVAAGTPRPGPRSPWPGPRSPRPGPRSPWPGPRSPWPRPRSPWPRPRSPWPRCWPECHRPRRCSTPTHRAGRVVDAW